MMSDEKKSAGKGRTPETNVDWDKFRGNDELWNNLEKKRKARDGNTKGKASRTVYPNH